MSIFGNLKSEGLEGKQDNLGGFAPFASDIYKAKIKAAYAGKSDGGASNVTLVMAIDNREYKETIYITNRKGENFFIPSNGSDKKVPLPGFTVIDDLCLATTEKPLSEQPTEDKVVKVYDPQLRQETPKNVPMLVDLIGKDVDLAIILQLENKQEKQADNTYAPVSDTRETNTIDKVFHQPTGMTIYEATQGGKEPLFRAAWLEKNKGTTRDKRKIKGDGTKGAPQEGATNTNTGNATKSGLFD